MQKCNQCHRAGPSLATCSSFMTCPGRVETYGKEPRRIDPESEFFPQVNPSKDCVIACSECKQTVALTAHDILVGKATVDFRCQRSPEHCAATISTAGFVDSPSTPKPKGRTAKAS